MKDLGQRNISDAYQRKLRPKSSYAGSIASGVKSKASTKVGS